MYHVPHCSETAHSGRRMQQIQEVKHFLFLGIKHLSSPVQHFLFSELSVQ